MMYRMAMEMVITCIYVSIFNNILLYDAEFELSLTSSFKASGGNGLHLACSHDYADF